MGAAEKIKHEIGGILWAALYFGIWSAPHVWVNVICVAGALLVWNAATIIRLHLGEFGFRKLFAVPRPHSRLMVTDAGDRIWVEVFGKPPSKTRFTGRSREILESSVVFEKREEIDRAIFISGPHRGSILASNWIGAISTRLVRLPNFMVDARNSMMSAATADTAGLLLQRTPNSIDTLSPNNFFVRQINRIPITESVPYHSIMGDRGKPEPRADSSDGVVAYWSSHLDEAESEKVVPSGHSAHQHPEGIEEVRRILRLHLGQKN